MNGHFMRKMLKNPTATYIYLNIFALMNGINR